MAAKPTVFIDGESGTTGLQIYQRLNQRDDIELVSIDPEKRKDVNERARLINTTDVSILCLPDAAAREVVSLVDNPTAKILDASTAHRTASGWVYGFPELKKGQREAISTANRVSNPGCYPTGFLACMKPLIAEEVLPPEFPVTINAVSGYSGGGKQMIRQYEETHGPSKPSTYPYGIYGLQFGHKHVKEMHQHSGLAYPPLFVPAVGDFEKGMLVQIPLPLQLLPEPPDGKYIHAILTEYYQDERFVSVAPFQGSHFQDEGDLRDGKFLDIQNENSTNQVRVFVFANGTDVLLVARLDNLGKGASGAAVQNLNIMLGFPESLGLELN